MDSLRQMLCQRIGIFYRDSKWAAEMFDKIYDYYHSLDMIDRVFRLAIRLKDNSEIIFVRAAENARGHHFSKVILQQGIDEELINCVIKHTYKRMSYTHCMMLDNNNEIKFL